jgi:hypothetical protein
VGENYQWQVFLRSPDGRLDRIPPDPESAAPELHFPAHSHVRLILSSRDFVYLVSIEGMADQANPSSQIAVPQQVYALDFHTGPEGHLLIRGDHLCGLPQPALNLCAIVENERDHLAWVAALRK